MAATAAARALEPAPAALARTSGRFSFGLAADGDDADIRRLLRENSLPGDVSLSFEREPSAAAAAAIEGDVHQTIVARNHETGLIAGIVSRSVRTAFVNGRRVRLGYLGQLRINGRTRHLRSLLDEGFAFCRGLHDCDDARLYLTSLVASNEAARHLLVDRRSASGPRFAPTGRFATYAISLSRLPGAVNVKGLQLCAGSIGLVEEIADCLDRNLRRYQFAPCWNADDLRSPIRLRLTPADFVVAVHQGRVVGCLALWDQRGFKQVVVRGYAPALRRWRLIANLAAPWLVPRLPSVGQALRFAYLSHVAVDEDRCDILAALVASACRTARVVGLDFVATGFDERHPFCRTIARHFRHRVYPSVLHSARWPDGDALALAVDDRLVQPEVAIL